MALAYFGLVLVFGHELTLDGPRVALGAALVVGSTLSDAGYLLYSGEVVQRIGALRLTGWASAVQYGMVGPVTTIALGVLILGEPFTAWVAAGTVCVLGGVALLARAR